MNIADSLTIAIYAHLLVKSIYVLISKYSGHFHHTNTWRQCLFNGSIRANDSTDNHDDCIWQMLTKVQEVPGNKSPARSGTKWCWTQCFCHFVFCAVRRLRESKCWSDGNNKTTHQVSGWSLLSWRGFPECAGIWRSSPTSHKTAPSCIVHPSSQHLCTGSCHLARSPYSL